MFFGIVGEQLAEVQQLPAHGGKSCCLWQADGVEIGFAVMQCHQKPLGIGVKTGADVGDQAFPRGDEIVDGDGDGRHTDEFARVGLIEIAEGRPEQFMRRAR